MRLRTLPWACAPFAAIAAVGCSAPVVDDVADASGGMTQGLVVVDRTTAADGSGAKASVSAKFLRTSATDPELAERVVGTRLELPPTGECASIADLASQDDVTSAAASAGPIELLDVGDVKVHSGGALVQLATRAFPDVGDLVSGVFYTSRDTATDLPPSSRFIVEGTGSAILSPFAVEAESPGAPSDVAFGERALADGMVLDEGAPLAIAWRADGAKATDLVYLDVRASGTAGGLRCTFPDVGRATVPAGALRGAGDVTIALHRVRQGAFTAPGIDLGEVRFDLAVVARGAFGG